MKHITTARRRRVTAPLASVLGAGMLLALIAIPHGAVAEDATTPSSPVPAAVGATLPVATPGAESNAQSPSSPSAAVADDKTEGRSGDVDSPAAAQSVGDATPNGGPAAVVDTHPGVHDTLPRDLSPWNMFLAADIVVKGVMISLAVASVLTWTVWFAKTIELAFAKAAVRRSLARLRAATSLADAETRLASARSPTGRLVAAAVREQKLSEGLADKSGIKERVASRLDDLVIGAGRSMTSGTGLLATVGSTAPFVGLFGTVWGIMNSFIGISQAQTTNLAIVAPGIAEALLATAIGLVAAIPAVVFYNALARAIAAYKAHVAEAATEVARLVSRDLDRAEAANAKLTLRAAE